MKKLFFFVFIIIAQSFYGQDKVIKKPEYVLIINNEIGTMADVEKYGAEGYVKSMVKGVSESERNELAKKFGDKIGDKEFIILIGIFSEQEKVENDKKIAAQSEKSQKLVKDDEYILKLN